MTEDECTQALQEARGEWRREPPFCPLIHDACRCTTSSKVGGRCVFLQWGYIYEHSAFAGEKLYVAVMPSCKIAQMLDTVDLEMFKS